MNDDITLSANLKKLAKKTSMRKLAKAAGIPQSSLASWSHGQLPSGAAGHKNLRRLCEHLHCSVETLMFGDIDAVSPKQKLVADLLDGKDVFEGKFVVDLKVKRIAEN